MLEQFGYLVDELLLEGPLAETKCEVAKAKRRSKPICERRERSAAGACQVPDMASLVPLPDRCGPINGARVGSLPALRADQGEAKLARVEYVAANRNVQAARNAIVDLVRRIEGVWPGRIAWSVLQECMRWWGRQNDAAVTEMRNYGWGEYVGLIECRIDVDDRFNAPVIEQAQSVRLPTQRQAPAPPSHCMTESKALGSGSGQDA